MSAPVQFAKREPTPNQRRAIAREIVRRIDTVTLATRDEVEDVHLRALAGEFDGIFEEEKVKA
jgi:hypothetical protein